jgi:hypothetical protein
MEEWQEKLIEEAEEKARRGVEEARNFYDRTIGETYRTLEIKKKIIAALREEPKFIMGRTDILIQTDNHELVHDVARTLGIKLERSAELDGFNFRGEFEGIDINVYGMQEVPHCKIVPKKKRKTVIVYETVCNGNDVKS